MTLKEMCDDIAAELTKRGSPISSEAVYALDAHGELSHVFAMYWQLFPERLPADVAEPSVGALRHHDGRVQAWTGHAWI